jgi:CubicO group peptidase (beta-lactamase class C family)
VIEGEVAPGFEPVREAFERNFREHGEIGASCGVFLDGRTVVDLWGGTANVPTKEPWSRDTLALTYSVTKGATATVLNLLSQQGELDLDAPVALLWPEFAANGKSEVTTRDILSHRAGLPTVGVSLDREQLLAIAPAVDALARARPLWPPGERHGYHAQTFGWLLGEIVRRATGTTLGQYMHDHVSEPLGIDFFIGCPVTEHPRVAHLVDAEPPSRSEIEAIGDSELRAQAEAVLSASSDPGSLPWRARNADGGLPAPSAAVWNDPAAWTSEHGGVNGITDGRSVARMYAALIGEVDGVRLLDESTLEEAIREQSSGPDPVLLRPTRFGSGYMLAPSCKLLSEGSFGHSGAGGALGFADRAAGIGFGYVQNLNCANLAGDPRTESLIAALQDVIADA